MASAASRERAAVEVARTHRLPTGDDEAVSRGRPHEPMIGPAPWGGPWLSRGAWAGVPPTKHFRRAQAMIMEYT